MKGCISALTLVLLGSATALAAAQERKSSVSPRSYGSDPFVSWAAIWGDPNHEGVYTCEQWRQYATRVFNEADRNHDGYLDAQEFEAVRKADPMFKDADIGYFDDNRDGRVSRSEFVDKPNPLFARYDKKGTCRVTLDDIVDLLSPKEKTRPERDRR
jgi:hypothetical protein